MAHKQKVCLISSGVHRHNLPLQPWRFLHETSRQLIRLGYDVTIVTNEHGKTTEGEMLDGVPLKYVPSINRLRWKKNEPLQRIVDELNPECILWHLGLTSYFHQRFDDWPLDVPVVGIFPGLIFRRKEILRNGFTKLAQGYQLSTIHLLSAAMPRIVLRKAMKLNPLDYMVVQTKAAAERLSESGFPSGRIKVIPPGVDGIWMAGNVEKAIRLRNKLGFRDDDMVIIYFGSPAPLRGLHTLIKAFEIARRTDTSLKLLILSRRRLDELQKEDRMFKKLLKSKEVRSHVEVISGFLPPKELRDYVFSADAAALPFELIPSDAPLSVLEAQALGRPVITSDLACLPELVSNGKHYLSLPGHPYSLALALLEAAQEKRREEIGFRRNRDVENPMVKRSWCKVGEEWSQLIQNI
jgi:glycosyltransferase involved in cell wall biosynthesis